MESGKVVAFTLILILALPTTGSLGRRTSTTPQLTSRGRNDEPADLRELLHEGNNLFRSGQYREAIRVYERGYREAKSRGISRSALRFLTNLGSAHFQMFQYREAVRAYLEAKDLATSRDDRKILGALYFNLSSLYAQLGEMEAAAESARQGLELPPEDTAGYKTKLQINSALLHARRKENGQAAALLRMAVEQSRIELDVATEAQAWNELGNLHLDAGEPDAAEHALLEAFRLRKLNHDGRIHYTYESLGKLSMLKGDPVSATVFFGRAIDAASGPFTAWRTYYERGRARLVGSQPQEAFADFRSALESARLYRSEVLPADAFRVSTDVKLQEVYSSFIELGARLYRQTHNPHFLEEAFAASEESRAASLRALLAGRDPTAGMPAAYREALSDLYRAEADLVRNESAAQAESVRTVRARVSEMQTRAGLEGPQYPGQLEGSRVLERTQRELAPGELFLGFHLGESESWLWAVTRESRELLRLEISPRFAEDAGRFAEAVRGNAVEAVALGRRLYSDLFGGVSPRLRQKPAWILALEGPLFEIPFAALVEEAEAGSNLPHYLIERHSIQIVPGVSALAPSTRPGPSSLIVGLGDPIYNRADPRWRPASPDAAPAAGGRSNSLAAETPMELARLPGSGREIENCGRIWRSHGGEPVLLTGAAANKCNLMAALRRNPSLVHLAAHFVFPSRSSGPGLIALTLQPGTQVELLSATEVAAMRQNLGLVVLNGCSSAKAAILPGAGLMGMTRAWLAAGARAVIATRWATADPEGGELFHPFYSRLAGAEPAPVRGAFAGMLRQAQLSELRAGGRRSSPAYWAAYFCVERN